MKTLPARLLLSAMLFLLLCPAAGAQPRTAYQCAMRAVRGLEGSFASFVSLVHPVKGLAYHESGADLGGDQPFSVRQLRAAMRDPASRVPIAAAYGSDAADSSVNIRAYLQRLAGVHRFSAARDIRRNITALAHSTELFRPAAAGETLISFHLASSKPDEELMWRCLVVRTETYRGRAWVVGIDYLYWTP